MKTLKTVSLVAISLTLCMLLAGCGDNSQELEKARAETTAAKAELAAAQQTLTDAQTQLAAAQEQLAAAQARSSTLEQTVKNLTTERDDAAKGADQASATLLNMLVRMQQQEIEHKTQIDALNAKIAQLTKK
ncbi:MAG: hypothetical protein IH624_20195 [Phycisphaerae bacterium]|nr:hypothetical protein [Phycisphaerae bacterium]